MTDAQSLQALGEAMAAVLAIDPLAAATQIADMLADDLDALATMLAVVDETDKHLKAIRDVISDAILPHLDPVPTAITSVGTLSRVGGGERKRYDQTRLVSALAARIADTIVDRETGEMPPLGAICQSVASEVASATGALAPSFTGWRSTVLKKHGLPAAAFSSWEPGGSPKVLLDRRA